jgi:hypothetical protein
LGDAEGRERCVWWGGIDVARRVHVYTMYRIICPGMGLILLGPAVSPG